MTLRESRIRVPRILVRLSALFALAALCFSLSTPQTAAAQADDAAAQQIVAMINGWRIDQGTWPLRENPTLDRMAYDQASYILSLPSIPAEGNIHLDAQDRGPTARARLPKYDWTPYGGDIYTAVGEIAYVGVNAAAARHFWDGSTIHHNTLLNPAYREIGVAVLPHRLGHAYFVDFGSRPDVLPAMADLQTNTLYLSNERYAHARTPWIGNVQRVRLFDAEGRSLSSGWMPWALQIPLPQGAGDSITVAYADGGDGMVLASVALDEQTSALPTGLPSATPTVSRSPTPTRTSTTPNTAATATMAGSPATATPTAATAAASGKSVTLLYDAHSLNLINTAQTAINVEEIVFVGQDGKPFAVTRWATQWLSGSLSALAAGDCLGAWSWTEARSPDKPSGCRQRRSVLTIAPNQLFWKQGDFEVRQNDVVLATCHVNETTCEFTLP